MGFFNLEVIAENVCNERTISGIPRMVFLKEEIEVVVGDPEVEGFRELKNERRESGFC